VAKCGQMRPNEDICKSILESVSQNGVRDVQYVDEGETRPEPEAERMEQLRMVCWWRVGNRAVGVDTKNLFLLP
jgi:hypothetical protein